MTQFTKKKIHYIYTDWVFLFAILTNYYWRTEGQMSFTPDYSNSGMIYSKLTNAHISHQSCSIFYYYDMKELHEMGMQIEHALVNLNKECDKSLDSPCKMEWDLRREQ